MGYPHLLRELRGSGLATTLAEGATLLTAAAGANPNPDPYREPNPNPSPAHRRRGRAAWLGLG